jgi:imidazolonepropionase-like amidohydrolase
MLRPAACLILVAAFAALPAARAAGADPGQRYTITVQSHVAGHEAVRRVAPGRWHVESSYRDNGRGPDLHEDYALAADGAPVHYAATGTSTFGAPIAETFDLDPGARGARWKSPAERAEAHAAAVPAGTPRTYVPIESSSVYAGVLARQSLRRAGAPVACWSGGAVSARRLLTMRAAPAAAGRPSAEVDLVVLQGLGLEPAYLWLRHGGDQALFAVVFPGFELIAEGFEPAGKGLIERQLTADRTLRAELAARLAHHVGDDLLIRNVRVFDSEHAVLGDPSDVYVSRGRIAQVVPAGSTPRGSFAVVDGTGRTLLPGLFDMHVHDGPWNGLLHLAGGVTSGRDMGNDNASLRTLMNEIDAGTTLGERIVPAGFIEGESPYASRSGFVVDNVADALKAVDWYAQRGYPQVKLYNSVHPDWVAPIAARAHERGLRVSGHVPAFMRAEEAVLAGYDEIQHINMLALNFLVTPTDDTRTLLRFDLVAAQGGTIDVDGEAVTRFIALLTSHGTAVDTTAATFEAQFTQMQGEANPSLSSVADHFPAVLRRQLLVNSSDVTAANVGASRAAYDVLLRLIGRLHAAGVPLEAGTDDTPGFMLHRELALYVKAGIPPAQALRIATWNGARFTKTLDRLGSVSPGKLADLVLVDGDPTRDIDDLRRISMVVKEGVLYFPAELYPVVGVQPFVPAPTVTRIEG